MQSRHRKVWVFNTFLHIAIQTGMVDIHCSTGTQFQFLFLNDACIDTTSSLQFKTTRAPHPCLQAGHQIIQTGLQDQRDVTKLSPTMKLNFVLAQLHLFERLTAFLLSRLTYFTSCRVPEDDFWASGSVLLRLLCANFISTIHP